MFITGNQIGRIRSNFDDNSTLLHERAGEMSFIPDEFVPHTLVAMSGKDANNPDSNQFYVINFEYSIDELPSAEKCLQPGYKLISGKFTDKVLSIKLECNNLKDLMVKTNVVAKLLNARKGMLAKESHKKNYELVSELLEQFTRKLYLDMK